MPHCRIGGRDLRVPRGYKRLSQPIQGKPWSRSEEPGEMPAPGTLHRSVEAWRLLQGMEWYLGNISSEGAKRIPWMSIWIKQQQMHLHECLQLGPHSTNISPTLRNVSFIHLKKEVEVWCGRERSISVSSRLGFLISTPTLLAVWLWANCSTSLSHSFLICSRRNITLLGLLYLNDTIYRKGYHKHLWILASVGQRSWNQSPTDTEKQLLFSH